MIGLIAVTASGRAAAARLAASWPGETRGYDGPAAQSLPRAWRECEDGLVCFLAAGAVIRLIAPLLASKRTDPAVVCVDEAARFTVPLVGGHAGGANALAVRAADALGAQPVITTASDAHSQAQIAADYERLSTVLDAAGVTEIVSFQRHRPARRENF